MIKRTLGSVLLLITSLASVARPDEAEPTGAEAAKGAARVAGDLSAIEHAFDQQILPLIETHCLGCHNSETREAELDLSRFHQLQDVTGAYPVWETVLERIEAGEMPPEDAEERLDETQRQALAEWIRAVRQAESARRAGDPGPVLARRLSNAEYDYSIRDLTGVDIRPTRTFPIDPANTAGFDNSGESLSMSPALMTKYLEAARHVVDHLVLTPRGIQFAPHPVVTDTDRDKYCVKRIVDFYQRQRTDLADYFFAAWQFRHRQALGRGEATLETIAAESDISPRYLATVWQVLSENQAEEDWAEMGPLATLRDRWNGLPAAEHTERAREECVRMRDYVTAVRRQFEPTFENLKIDGVHDGSQAFVIWKNKQYASHRRTADFSSLDARESQGNSAAEEWAIGWPEEADREIFKAECRRFCDVFPDAFYVSERGRDYLGVPKAEQEKGRLLSAGFHSMMGYFRDDGPLYEMILDERGREELDALWQDLNFFAAAPLRQYQGLLWFERTDSGFLRDAEFDFARPENKAALSEPMIERLAELYVAKAVEHGGSEVPLQAIRDYFQEINQQIRSVELTRIAAQPHHLEDVVAFAERAYRRPLSAADEEDLRDFYTSLRSVDGLTHEEAIEDTLVAILMSPRFSYRLDLLSDSAAARPLDDYELASRLSYFLWSSLPDEELLQHAAAGDLHETATLLAQTRRMLADERVRALAMEFGGHWLDFRRFEQHNSVDRERFPSFDDALRSAMFEEPIRLILDMIQHNRSTLDLLYGSRTFVNRPLAQHYRIEGLDLAEGEWREIEDATPYGRGGLLPMAVFLTQNSPGLRTSPVKRGYWVVRQLLGERIPPPPPDVPELPSDESQLGELTLRETLALHRQHPNCAGCHDRFDSIGVVFESFGPIGERRQTDLAGRAIDTLATFPDHSDRDGMEGLRRYIEEQREDDFVDNLSRKLVSYALSRTLLLGDEALLEQMREQSAAGDHRFRTLVEAIVTSPQFLNKRGRDASDH